MKPMTLRPLVLIALMILAAAGCDEDKRVVKVATEAADRQAEQNRQIAKQNHEISGATKSLVEADAQARKELVTIQKELQAQQAEVGRQWSIAKSGAATARGWVPGPNRCSCR